MIFDGRAAAKKIEAELLASGRVAGKSLLILQCDGSNRESTYIRLKREMGERLGVRVNVEQLQTKKEISERLTRIEEDGVLVQLPILGAGREETEAILAAIPVEKDVDGLNRSSDFQPAAVLAVLLILKEAGVGLGRRAAVVGSDGVVGRRLMRDLALEGYSCLGFDLGDDLAGLSVCDTVISAAGVAGLITAEMVRDGVVAVDLGFPLGEFTPEAAHKAGFLTPVPGGVGPLTIVCLYLNLAGV